VKVLLALGVPAEAGAEAGAEGMEHYVSDSTLKAFAQFLQPQTVQAGRSRILEGQRGVLGSIGRRSWLWLRRLQSRLLLRKRQVR
jgi:Mn-dependent DtxR family transcriptional regulator